jgi:hypothetical protein
MPAKWTNKDERQYEHIKESSQERGVPVERAKEIAARTVNKHRRTEGRTPNKRTQGTGNPNRPLAERTRDELYNMARDKNVPQRSHMSKGQLIKALQR